MKSRSAFTLVEMAMVLIVMGIIVGSSTKLFTSLAKNAKRQETKELLKEISLDIEGFVKTFYRLPTQEELKSFRMQSKDSWGKEILYIPSEILKTAICRQKVSSLEHVQNDKHVKNLAYVLLSSGPNRNMQTRVEGTSSLKVTTAKAWETVDFNKALIDRVEPYDDFYKTKTLWSLKAELQCKKEALR